MGVYIQSNELRLVNKKNNRHAELYDSSSDNEEGIEQQHISLNIDNEYSKTITKEAVIFIYIFLCLTPLLYFSILNDFKTLSKILPKIFIFSLSANEFYLIISYNIKCFVFGMFLGSFALFTESIIYQRTRIIKWIKYNKKSFFLYMIGFILGIFLRILYNFFYVNIKNILLL